MQELMEVFSSKFPLEGLGNGFVVALESFQTVRQRFQVWKIIRREDLALDNGEVNLDLIEPTGMHWTMNHMNV